eukprot:jgi/Mesvir1/17797/Mv12902-RA.1
MHLGARKAGLIALEASTIAWASRWPHFEICNKYLAVTRYMLDFNGALPRAAPLPGNTHHPAPMAKGHGSAHLPTPPTDGRATGSKDSAGANHGGASAREHHLHPEASNGADALLPRWSPPAGGPVFDVRKYGAVGDGKTNDTDAVLAAFAAAKAAGGGLILFPPGTYLSLPVRLSSHTVVHLEGPKAVLAALTDLHHWPMVSYLEYPLVPSYEPKVNFVAFVGGAFLRNVTITGGGTIDGQGPWWWGMEKHNALAAGRPPLLHVLACTNVTVRDVTLRGSPKEGFRPQSCRDVLADRVLVSNAGKSFNTNGIKVDSCQNVVIRNSVVHTGDKEDVIVIKSGKDWWGRNASRPARDILVEDCVITNGHAISVGSEMSGGVFNVTFRRIVFDGRKSEGRGVGSIRVKSERGRGGLVDGIYFEDIWGWEAYYAVEIYMQYEGDDEDGPSQLVDETPTLRNIYVRDVRMYSVTRRAGIISGLPESPIHGLYLHNITVDSAPEGGGWDCVKYRHSCTWHDGGCAFGQASMLQPPLPKHCLLPPGAQPIIITPPAHDSPHASVHGEGPAPHRGAASNAAGAPWSAQHAEEPEFDAIAAARMGLLPPALGPGSGSAYGCGGAHCTSNVGTSAGGQAATGTLAGVTPAGHRDMTQGGGSWPRPMSSNGGTGSQRAGVDMRTLNNLVSQAQGRPYAAQGRMGSAGGSPHMGAAGSSSNSLRGDTMWSAPNRRVGGPVGWSGQP